MKTLYRVEVRHVFYALAENENEAEWTKTEALGDETEEWVDARPVIPGDALATGWDGGCLVYQDGPTSDRKDIALRDVWPGGFPGGAG